MRLGIVIGLALALGIPPIASAQGTEHGREVYATAGWGWMQDDVGSLGNGIDVGGGIAARPLPRLAFEFEVNAQRHERSRLRGSILDRRIERAEAIATYFLGNVIYHFSSGRVQPFVLVGAGLMIHNATNHVRQFPDPLDPTQFEDFSVRGTGVGPAAGFGGGVKFFVRENISLRPEVRILAGWPFESPVGDRYLGAVRVSLGVGYHW